MKRSALKRTQGLKRGAPLKRTTALKQGSTPLAKTRLSQSPPRQADGALVKAFFDTVLTVPSRDGKGRVPARCAVCGTTRRLDPHHVYPKQKIKAACRTLRLTDKQTDALVWDVRNGLPVCREDHDRHEVGHRRISRTVLPIETWEFAAELDAALGTEQAVGYLKRTYPE